MRTALLVVASSLLASAIAVTAVHLAPPQVGDAASPDSAVADVAGEQRASIQRSVEDILARLDQLEQRVWRASVRQVVPDAEDPSRPVAADTGETGEVAAKAAKPGKLDVAATVARLCSGKASWDEQQALWSKLTPEQQDELLRAMEATARAWSHSADVQNGLGEAYTHRLMNGDMAVMMTFGPKAEQAFLKTLELDSHHGRGRFNLAMNLANQPDFLGRRPEAITHFQTLIKQQEQLPPDTESHPASYLFLGNLYSQQGDREKAAKVWGDGLKRFPTNDALKGKLKKK